MKPKLVLLTISFFCLILSNFSFAENNSDLTIMVYLGADNDLSEALVSDLSEMKLATIQKGVSVVYAYDGPKTAYRGVIENGKSNYEAIADFNSADPKELAKFITWASGVRPAKKYMLVLSDHGRGWKSYYPDINDKRMRKQNVKPQSIIIDLKSQNEMSLFSLNKALAFVKAHGIAFEVIAFDACLMAMAEVVYNVSEYAKVVIASETAALGKGWNYTDFLSKLNKFDGESIGLLATKSYIESNAKEAKQTNTPITISAINTFKFREFTNTILMGYFEKLATAGMTRAKYLKFTQKAQKFAEGNVDTYVDLGDFLNQIATDDSKRVKNFLSATVIANYSYGFDVSKISGLSIYAPSKAVEQEYLNLGFSQKSSWGKVLTKLLGPSVYESPIHTIKYTRSKSKN